jgi:hypothetical protein
MHDPMVDERLFGVKTALEHMFARPPDRCYLAAQRTGG